MLGQRRRRWPSIQSTLWVSEDGILTGQRNNYVTGGLCGLTSCLLRRHFTFCSQHVTPFTRTRHLLPRHPRGTLPERGRETGADQSPPGEQTARGARRPGQIPTRREQTPGISADFEHGEICLGKQCDLT